MPPLEELRNCISQLEELVNVARQRLSAQATNKGKLKQNQSQKRNKLRRDKRTRKHESDSENSNSLISSQKQQPEQRQAQQNKKSLPKAQFISIEPHQENEMVEVIRRLAEIVVLGELSSAEEADNNNTSVSIFEHFCERNVLGLIVNIVTGIAFEIIDENDSNLQPKDQTSSPEPEKNSPAKETNDKSKDANSDDKSTLVYLPPVSVATQAIQSVSILIQNVVRVTSLYFLLSNNRVNDLIHLPLELYALAEERERRHDKKNHNKNGGNLRAKSELSAEMSELATHFISFLKSLALRMNVETLQFFLTYPSAVVGPNSTCAVENMSNVKDVEFPLYARALEFCSPNHDNFVRVTAMNICLNTLRLGAVNEPDNLDDSSQSSVSTGITSKSITIGKGSIDSEGKVSFSEHSSEEKVSPDGSLHHAEILPLRERLAIVKHICDPSRVESLMSPIFFKLAQLCGYIEESLRSLENIDKSICSSVSSVASISRRIKQKQVENTSSPRKSPSKTPTNHLDSALLLEEKKNRQKFMDERKKAVQSIKNYVADLQDELLLLEDVLQVGLVTLNEQIIEMMFATFIYPLLLQPLSLFMQRHRPKSLTSNGDDNEGSSSSLTTPVLSDETKSNHPFASITPSLSLNRWGVLNKDKQNGDKDENKFPSSTAEENTPFTNLSSNPDSSPARMALFGMASIFHVISNKPLLHLLLTALLYPLAPDPSVGFMVSRNQQILIKNKKGKLKIHVESIMSAFRKSSSMPESYKFGTEDLVKDMENATIEQIQNGVRGEKKCTFVLSPALADVFEGAIYGKSPSLVKTRTNPYRRVFLACLAGTDGMSTLQPLAVLVLDAVLSSLSKRVSNDIIFGAKIAMKSDSDSIPGKDKTKIKKNNKSTQTTASSSSAAQNHMLEVIASMCVSVMTAATSVNGVWRMKFDPVASHALLCATMVNESAQATAAKLIDHRCRQSLSFLTELPHKLNILTLSGFDGSGMAAYHDSVEHDDQRMSSIMDGIFFDPLCDEKCIVEQLSRKQTSDTTKDEWNGPGCVSVARESSIDELCTELSASVISSSDLFNVEGEDIPYRFAADSVASHMQLEAFSKILKDIPIGNKHDKKSGCSGIVALVQHKKNLVHHIGGDDRTLFTPIPETLNKILFGEEEGGSLLSGNHESQCPTTGSTVGLVGKTTFPCVCEVAEESDSLFTDKAASVVAEGVKWQSIYLVLMGKHMILAEPEKGGSGGNGRVVTACRLACLDVEKDNPNVIESASPARRLLLTHTSPCVTAPGVFTPENNENATIRKQHPSRVTMYRSRMDLWFEDSTSAGHAYRVLSTKVARAKARRGHKIREILANDEQLGFSSVFNNS